MRRTAVVVAAVLVALAGAVGLIAFFQSRDEPELGSGRSAREPGAPAPEEASATLKRGNVIITFRVPADEPTLRALAEDVVGGPSSPELVDAGQAVIVERRADQGERIVAHAYERRIAAQTPSDPALREFIEAFLGTGSLEP